MHHRTTTPVEIQASGHNVVRYMIRRLLWAVVLFFAVTVVSYVLFFIIPADPAKQFAGKGANADTIAKAKHFLGLDRPIYEQYGKFVWRLVYHHDLGLLLVQPRERQHTHSRTPRRSPPRSSSAARSSGC